MIRNKSGQIFTAQMIDSTSATRAGRTGDAANLTAKVSINGGTMTTLTDASATEVTGGNGLYKWDLTATETNGAVLDFLVTSSTANTIVYREKVYTAPPAYSVHVAYRRDDSNAQDEYDVRFYDGTEEITGGISSATLAVNKPDGTALFSAAALTNVAGNAAWRKTESTNRQTAGDTHTAIVVATIDGVSRTFYDLMGRD